MSQTPPAMYITYVGKSWLKDMAVSARFLKFAPLISLARILFGMVFLSSFSHNKSCRLAPRESVIKIESRGILTVVIDCNRFILAG